MIEKVSLTWSYSKAAEWEEQQTGLEIKQAHWPIAIKICDDPQNVKTKGPNDH